MEGLQFHITKMIHQPTPPMAPERTSSPAISRMSQDVCVVDGEMHVT